ncbi:MAG TPA: hypothetical protein VF079_01835, partial [Sphingomicrobium sp.]
MSNCLSCGCGLATCGCCAGIETVTPKTVGNPPGRSALDVRIGRHGDFLASMLARLSSHRDEDHSAPLELLRTREPDDLTISLLDGLAAAGDVLTFYNERIANEGYLPTATDNRSVEALAQLVGYRPQPGVAASVFLAFGIDPNTTDPVRIDKGLGVKTVPAQDELPQIFETSEALEARAAWNQLGLRKTLPQMINPMAAGSLWLAGTDANLAIGDALLIETSAKSVPAPVRVLEVITDPDAQLTKVRFEPWAAAALNDPDLAELIAKGARFIDDDLVAVLEAAEELQDSPRAGSAAPLLMLARDARARAESVEGPQIKAFIERIAERAEKLAGEVPVGPTAETAAPHEAVPFDDRLKRLSAPPAPVLASAARIVRQTTDSFRETAAAPLAIVARTAPVAGPQLGDALAGYRAAAPEAPLKVYAMRVRSGVFGRTFPKRMQATRDANGAVGEMTEIGEWPIVDANRKRTWIRHEKPSVITLDAVHDGIAPQSWVMVDMRGLNRVGKDLMVRVGPADPVLIVRAIEVLPKIARADYGGSGESTAIRLPGDQPWLVYAKPKDFANVSPNDQDMIDREFGLIRRTTVYAAPEELPLAQQPIEEPLCVDKDAGFVVELDALYADLEAGRYVIVSGERADIPETEGITASEVAMIAGVSHDVRRLPPDANGRRLPLPGESNHTFITFAAPLAYCYKRATVTISGNVVKATHGETRREVLGSGDASKPNLSLPLKQAPLTFVAAPTARGAEAALEIWVDDIRWREADDLVDAPPTARLYQLRTAEGGKAEIQFGDGKEGARPPTGTQNIRSVYRTGIGQPGNASARQINQLVSRPAGLRDVVNPLPATGGADPEDRDQIRRNAPLATMA